MVGLIHPSDLEAWQHWQASRHRLRTLVHHLRPQVPSTLWLTRTSPDADILVALDSGGMSSRHALAAPLHHLDPTRVAVLAARPRNDLVTADATVVAIDSIETLASALPAVAAVLSSGDYLPAGALAHALARRTGVTSHVAQHGLMTPHAPPLPSGSVLLAWHEADATFWRSGRTDVAAVVVGSQLLWAAAQRGAPIGAAGTSPSAPPTFLGQLHGAELPRGEIARVAFEFCKDTGATYRPHPSEVDRVSRAQHAVWHRRGVRFDDGAVPLAQLEAPVVALFSTGVLEAAAAGRAAWVHHPTPPAWLADLWERYGLSRWGSDPTPAPALPAQEPAQAIAALLTDTADARRSRP